MALTLIIIAAGEGSRIRPMGNTVPKTLLKVGGYPILHFLLDNCQQVGITDCVLVTGYQGDKITDYLKTVTSSLNIETTYNPDWKSPNGMSVLTAKPFIPEGDTFLISMSDHLYSPKILDLVANSSLDKPVANVALDFNLAKIFDLDDAMKVAVSPSDHQVVTGMSKHLVDFNAIDCGIFKCRYEFFQALETASKQGSCSLADACNILIPNRELGGVDIGELDWIDIDTPEAFQYAEENCTRFRSR